MTACSIKPAISASPKIVSVNGVVIPREDIARETQNHPATTPLDAWRAAARALAIRELLRQEADRLAVSAEPQEDEEGRRETSDEARMRALIDREVITPTADDQACRRIYDQHPQKFAAPTLFEARHILLAAPRDAAGRAEARKRAETLIAQLQDDPSLFAAFAQSVSACPSREVGGNLGQISRGQTAPEFEAALERIEPGRIHPEPVETRYGFHIVLVERRIDGRKPPFEIVRARIAAWLEECARRQALRQYVSLLSGRADIRGIAFDGAQSPLVQ